MPYIPHTPEETRAMLETIGASSLDDLFAEIPAHLRAKALDLPAGLNELEALQMMEAVAAQNKSTKQFASYLGGGAYEHFIPAIVPALAFRGEFATAYTPYQAEASQGTLQAVYEFQSMLCLLTELEVANASMYDGASALAEAVLMAVRLNGRKRVLVPAGLNPRYRQALQTYTHNLGVNLVTLPLAAKGGASDLAALATIGAEHGSALTAVVIPVTNFLGACEPWEELAAFAKKHGAATIAVANPMSLSALPGPGAWGADICIGEAQPLGLPLGWGGPYCGFMTAKAEHIRKMPGRIVGCSTDAKGRRAFTLTLQTREQHIRRDKATSNICTNQGLMALQVCIYLAAVGRDGLRRLGQANLDRAGYLRQQVLQQPGVQAVTGDDFFNEFAVRLPVPAAQVIAAMRKDGIIAGIDGGATGFDPHYLLVCATETKSRAHLDAYAASLGRAIATRQPALANR